MGTPGLYTSIDASLASLHREGVEHCGERENTRRAGRISAIDRFKDK